MTRKKTAAQSKAVKKKTTRGKNTTKKAQKKTTAKKRTSKKKTALKEPEVKSPAEEAKRDDMIQVAAYYLAEKTNFTGNTLDHWVQAEDEISIQLTMR